jgi:hypothetical protein
VRKVDGYQGGETTFVLLDLVITNELGFLRDGNQVNVVLTRARDNLIVIGNSRGIGRCYGRQRDRRTLMEVIDNFKTTDQEITVACEYLDGETANEYLEATNYKATIPEYNPERYHDPRQNWRCRKADRTCE